MYTPPLILFPFAAPLIKRLAHWFPDEGLARVKAGRQVIIDIVKELLAQRREEIAVEQVSSSCSAAAQRAQDLAVRVDGRMSVSAEGRDTLQRCSSVRKQQRLFVACMQGKCSLPDGHSSVRESSRLGIREHSRCSGRVKLQN